MSGTRGKTEVVFHNPSGAGATFHDIYTVRRAASRTDGANDHRQTYMLAKVERARELEAEGKSTARIAQIMTGEVKNAAGELVYSQDKPLTERQVHRWLACRKTDTTT